MGVTASSPANLVVGAGDVTVDTVDVGVTADDNTFRIEEEIFEPDNLNGVPGMLVATAYKIRGRGQLTCRLPEVNATIVGHLWPGSQSAVVGDATTIDWDGTRRIPTAAYKDWVLTVPGLDGKSFAFQVDDGLNMAASDYAAQNAGLLGPQAEIHSHWDAASLTASPYRIVVTDAGS